MNFGKWIVVAFVLFAVFIGTLVTVCIKQDINLVSKDYYKDELAYQDQIKRISNTKALINKPTINKIKDGHVEVSFAQSIDKGQLKLFCPSDQKMDRSFDIKHSTDNKQLFDVGGLKSGMYRAKLFWAKNGEEYFLEKIIFI